MGYLEQEQWKLITSIYQEVWIANEQNYKLIKDTEFDIALAVKMDHQYQINFLEYQLDLYKKNKKLIDNLNKLYINFQKWTEKNG